MNNDEKLWQRLNDVESSLAHLQQDFDALNEAILLYAKRFDQIHGRLDQMTDQIKAVQDAEQPNDPLDEKPPHY